MDISIQFIWKLVSFFGGGAARHTLATHGKSALPWRWQMALALLRAMQDSQLDGDTVAYNAAISAWGTHNTLRFRKETGVC